MTNPLTTGSQLIRQQFGLDLPPLEITRNAVGELIAATFQIDNAHIRFIREHGEDFLDLASSFEPTHFFVFDDVDLAFGWKTLEEVLAKRFPEPVRDVLSRLAEKRNELMAALDSGKYRKTIERLEQARQRREQAFVARLR